MKNEKATNAAKAGEGAISFEELTGVSGGEAIPELTVMVCSVCGYEETRSGDLVNKLFDCPGCGRTLSLKGKYLSK